MRTPLARLVGLAAAGSLILSPLAVAGPASAVDPGNGIISVTLVDDLGQPVKGAVQLYPSGGGTPVYLGLPEGGGPPVAAPSFSEEIPTGTYGAMVYGGWAGVSCVGLTSCTGVTAPEPSAGAFDVTEAGTTPLTIVIATPKLTGSPGIGLPLTVSVPSSLSDLGALVSGGGVGGLGLSSDPIVTWNRNGEPLGATGKTYSPTAADAGATVSATVTFPPLLALLMSSAASGSTPPPFTTQAVSIGRVTPSVKLSVPGKVKQGARPLAYVNVKYGQALVGGVVKLAVGKARPLQAVLRSGLATFKLPKLKPGKYKLTASYAAAGAYNAAKVSKTVVVKGKKPKKGKKK